MLAVIAAGAAIVAAFLGSGALGPDQAQVGDGALAPEATLIAPARPAFAIWSVIYSGLVAWAVWQALPAGRADPRRVRWLLVGSLVLNAAWIAVVQLGLLGLSVPVIVALLGVLVVLVSRLQAVPARSPVERLLVDATAGLYLGWVSLATIANVAAVLASAGYDSLGLGGVTWAVLLLGVAGALAVVLTVWSGGRSTAPLAIAWGVAWVAVARTSGPESAVVAGTAVVVAAVVLLASAAGALVRLRGTRPGRTPRAG